MEMGHLHASFVRALPSARSRSVDGSRRRARLSERGSPAPSSAFRTVPTTSPHTLFANLLLGALRLTSSSSETALVLTATSASHPPLASPPDGYSVASSFRRLHRDRLMYDNSIRFRPRAARRSPAPCSWCDVWRMKPRYRRRLAVPLPYAKADPVRSITGPRGSRHVTTYVGATSQSDRRVDIVHVPFTARPPRSSICSAATCRRHSTTFRARSGTSSPAGCARSA